MRLLAVALVLLLTPLSGCLDAGQTDEADVLPVVDALSEKLYEVLPVEELRVAASDGTGLHNAVYRPDTQEPVPVFINFSPYWGDTAETGGDAFSRYLISEYVPRGYAVVLSAVRGTGHSDGCFQIGGDREVEDLWDVIDHFANVAWSNGNVAAGGKSYDSTTQNGLIAKMPHPALKGVFHVSGITDMYAYNSKAGLPYTTGPVFNTYYYLQGTDEYGASLVGAGSHGDEDPESLTRLLDDAACPELPFIQAHGVGSGVSGQKTDYWVERDWNRYIADSEWNGSIFFVHGLQDWNVKPDHVLPWLELLPEQVRVKGWLHQWTSPGSGGHVYPMRTDWNHTMLAWLDTELKGKRLGFWDGPAFEVQGSDERWRASDAWPPAPWAPHATEGETSLTRGSIDTVRYTFNGTYRIAGTPLVEATVSSPVPDGAVVASFYDVAPDGTATWFTEAPLRLLYRDGLDEPVPYTPGEELDVTLTAFPVDHVLPEGHVLELRFTEGGRYVVTTPAQTDAVTVSLATLKVHVLDPDHGLLTHQPVPMECFAC